MKLALIIIMLTTLLAVRSIPVDNAQDENYITAKGSKESGGNDLKPAEFFYPGIGLGFGFPFPGYSFYSKPYWHPFHAFKPYYTGYYTGLGHGSHWHYKY